MINEEKSSARENTTGQTSKIFRLQVEIRRMRNELLESKTRIGKARDACEKLDLESSRRKWMQEKAGIVLKCNESLHKYYKEQMKVIRKNYLDLTTRRANSEKEISTRVKKLTERKDQLKDELMKLRNAREEDLNKLSKMKKQIAEQREAKDALIMQLRRKVRTSEALKINALAKLNELRCEKKTWKNDALTSKK